MDTNTKNITEPLVSILMLTYNRAHYLSQAIESVLAQTYSHWELIIIDDGSTDTTETVVGAYTDPRIRYIKHSQNAGLLVRRKESLQEARGVYIAVLDSDDVWLFPEKLEKQVQFLEEHPEHVLVGTFATLADARGATTGRRTFSITNTAIRRHILVRNQFIHSSVLLRANAISRTEGYRVPLAEDLDLFLQLGYVGKMANLPLYMTMHRVHPHSENDRGLEMAYAIKSVIRVHKNRYPLYVLGYMVNQCRILRSTLFPGM